MSLPARAERLDDARRRFGDRVDRLGAFFAKCDPLADACVDAFAALPKGQSQPLVERALAGGHEAVKRDCAPLAELMEAVEHVPPWVDWEALDRGGELLLRTGPLGALVLAFRSLVLAYAAPGGNKPLVLSGRLTEQAARRLAETGRFVHATCVHGGLRRHADGFRITVKVRLMHAQMRRLARRSGQWRPELWGEPINQHDMLGTLLVFSIALLDGLRLVGFRVTDDEADAYVQLWRYSGYLLGLDPELSPTSEREARRFADTMSAMQGPPDDDARALVAALFGPGLGPTHSRAEELARAAYRRFAMGLSRGLVGDAVADGVGLPDDRFRHAIDALRPGVRAAERVRLASPLAHRAYVNAGNARWRRVVETGLGAERPEFQVSTLRGSTPR
ncbi:MAG: DUF2236 domain-containing protein [Myxococcales bacterium]|nr:DUF2236 domain-containing protein [Myxococcales bacterium]